MDKELAKLGNRIALLENGHDGRSQSADAANLAELTKRIGQTERELQQYQYQGWLFNSLTDK